MRNELERHLLSSWTPAVEYHFWWHAAPVYGIHSSREPAHPIYDWILKQVYYMLWTKIPPLPVCQDLHHELRGVRALSVGTRLCCFFLNLWWITVKTSRKNFASTCNSSLGLFSYVDMGYNTSLFIHCKWKKRKKFCHFKLLMGFHLNDILKHMPKFLSCYIFFCYKWSSFH